MPFIGAAIGAVAGAIGAAGAFLGGLGIVGKTLLAVGLNIGLSFLAKKLAPKQAKPVSGVETEIQSGGEVPRQVALGVVATAGQLVYWNTYGDTNKYLQLVFALSDMRCDGLNRVWVDGEAKALNAVSIPEGNTEHARYQVAGYGSKFVVRFFDGRTGQAADAELVGHARGTAGGGTKWSADDRGSGVCYVSLTLTYDDELFTNGIPTCLWELRGALLYDPREDTSVGGDGLQRFDDPDTWAFSEKPAVALYHFRRGFYVNGERLCGMAMPGTDIGTAFTMAAANICDESVSKAGGGTEARYRVSLIARDDAEHFDAIEALQQAMAGFEVERAGSFCAFAGAAQVPVTTITDGDLVVGRPVRFTARAPRDQIANAVFGTYLEPDEQWQGTSFTPLVDSAAETEDGGERLPATIDLGMVSSKTQAERIAAIRFYESRKQGSASIPVGSHLVALEAGDWIVWNSARFGSRTWLIVRVTENRDNSLQLELKEVSSGTYSSTGLPLNPYEPPATPNVDALPSNVSSFAVQATTIEQGEIGIPAIRCSWTPPDDARVLAVIIDYRVAGTVAGTRLRDDTPEDGEYHITQGIVPGVDYEVRATIVTDPPRLTTWSLFLLVTATSANPFLDSVQEEIDQAVAGAAATVATSEARLRDLLEQTALDAAVEAGNSFFSRSVMKREQLTQYGILSASIAQETALRASADGVLAGQITTLQTQVGEDLQATISQFLWSIDGTEVRAGWIGTINGETGGFVFSGVLVDGEVLYSVEIDGDLVVDGSITATKLSVTSLSAISANIGEVTAGLLKGPSDRLLLDLTNGRLVISDDDD